MDPDFLASLLQRITGAADQSQRAGNPMTKESPLFPGMGPAAPGPLPYYLAAPGGGGGGLTYGGSNADQDATARVTALINGMETQQGPPPPPRRSTWNKVLGALGDALSNYGSVRAGGGVQPVGPYSAGVQGERLRFESASQEAAKNNAAIRNQMRLAAFQKEQDRITAKEVAQIRATAPNRSLRTANESQTMDIFGSPTVVTFIRDPFTGNVQDVQIGGQSVMDNDEVMAEVQKGFKGFAPFMTTGLTGPPGNQKAGTYLMNRTTGRLMRNTGITPMPQASFSKDVAANEGAFGALPGVVKAFNDAVAETGENAPSWTPEFMNKVMNYTNAKIANTSMKDLFSTPKMIDYYDQARAVLTPYIRAVSGLTVPEAEYLRYERRLPIPGVTSPENVIGRWNSLVREMLRDMEARYRVEGRTPPQRLTEILKQIDQQLPTEMLGFDANGNPETGQAPGEFDDDKFFAELDARRKANANPPQP